MKRLQIPLGRPIGKLHAWQGFELGATVKPIQVVFRAGLKPRTAGLQVRRADHSATGARGDKQVTNTCTKINLY